MIFESNIFYFSQSAYKKARKEVINKIKDYYKIKTVRLPWGALVLYGQLESGEWVKLSDMAQNAKAFSNINNYKIRSQKLFKRGK